MLLPYEKTYGHQKAVCCVTCRKLHAASSLDKLASSRINHTSIPELNSSFNDKLLVNEGLGEFIMPDKMKWILKNIKTLSPHEKATLAHCLISSQDYTNEEHVDEAWIQITERRFAQLEFGAVQPVSWEEIKLKLNREL